MNKNSCYAFYGSLRRGMYNYLRFKDNLQFRQVEVIAGFRLYALPHYPIAVRTDNPNDLITVEIMQVMNKQTESDIHELELSAGYYYADIDIHEITVGIYLFRENHNYPVVKSGDWVAFKHQSLINSNNAPQ